MATTANRKVDVDYKKFLIGAPAADGGLGVNLEEIDGFIRQGTGEFGGSDSSDTTHKNTHGDTLAISSVKGDYMFNLQCADVTPENKQKLMGGTVTTDTTGSTWTPNEDNDPVYKSIVIVGDNNIVEFAANVKIDAYTKKGDADLAYLQVNGTVLKPTKTDEPAHGTYVAADPSDATVESFSFLVGATTVAGVVDNSARTITATTAVLTAIAADIEVAPIGSNAIPVGGSVVDYTAAQTLEVKATDGTIIEYTVTITTV